MTFYNTLLELYLRERAEKEKEGKADAELDQRIIDLIKNNASPYQNEKDLDQPLVLCQMYDFGPGMLYILEKAKMYISLFISVYNPFFNDRFEAPEYSSISYREEEFCGSFAHLSAFWVCY